MPAIHDARFVSPCTRTEVYSPTVWRCSRMGLGARAASPAQVSIAYVSCAGQAAPRSGRAARPYEGI